MLRGVTIILCWGLLVGCTGKDGVDIITPTKDTPSSDTHGGDGGDGGDGGEESRSPSESVGGGGETSGDSESKLPSPPVRLRFVAVGDTGMGSASLQPDVAAAMAAVCEKEGCDFAVMLGDNFYPDGVHSVDDVQFAEKFEKPYGGLGIPIYVSLGNHDYAESLSKGSIDVAAAAYQVAYAETSSVFVLPSTAYGFSLEGVDFFVLDTTLLAKGVDETGEPGRSAQYDDLPEALAASESPLKIALGHHPYRSNGKHGNAGQYDGQKGVCEPGSMTQQDVHSGQCFREFFETNLCGGVQLYLSGHDHSLQYLESSETCSVELLVSGAGSKVDSGTDPDGEKHTLSKDNPAFYQESTGGFFWVDVCASQGEIAEVRAYGTDAKMRYSRIGVPCIED